MDGDALNGVQQAALQYKLNDTAAPGGGCGKHREGIPVSVVQLWESRRSPSLRSGLEVCDAVSNRRESTVCIRLH